MRRHWSPAVAVAVFGAILTARVCAQSSDAEKQVLAAEQARVAALDRGDVAALDRIIADDLTYVHASGRVDTKSSLLGAIRSGELHYISWEPKRMQARVLGDTAVIDGEYTVHVKDSRVQKDPFSVNVFFLGVYALRNGRWQQIAWESTRDVGMAQGR
jgi:hypothetical protein